MYIFSFRSFIQRAPPRPKSFHASSSSSAEASSIASHIASVTTRARSHRDASIFRVHLFAHSRRRRFVAPFPSSASSTGASISALNCTSATRRDDTTHHRQSASARSTPSSRDRPRVSRRIESKSHRIHRAIRPSRTRSNARTVVGQSLARPRLVHGVDDAPIDARDRVVHGRRRVRTNARRARTHHHHPPTYTRHTYPINEHIP